MIGSSFVEKHKNRIVGLDILRSVAILLVVYSHGFFFLPKQFHATYEKLNPIKIDGVSIFFVLSGFLIGGILLRTISKTEFNRADLFNFWIRRWFRTIPNYLLLVIGLLIYSLLVYHNAADFDLRYLVFSQNLATRHPDFFPEAWSLTIEEWFYLTFPVCCFILIRISRNKTRSILISAIFFLVFPLLLRINAYSPSMNNVDFDLYIRKVVLLRLDSLMYGVLGAYVVFKQPAFWERSKYVFLLVGIALVVLMNIDPYNWTRAYLPIAFNLESVATFCFLPYLSTLKTTRVRVLDVLFIFISIISYSMYLLNFTPVMGIMMPAINSVLGRKGLPPEETYIFNYILFWFLTIVCSYALYRFYEKPMTDLREKFN